MSKKLEVLFLFAAGAGLAIAACAAPPEGSKPAESGKMADSAVAATIGDRTISIAELDEQAKKIQPDVYQKLYEARRQALDQLIADALVEKEAAARGISAEDLLKQEVESKLAAPTDAQVEEFFNQNKSQMGSQTLEQMSGRIRNYMAQQQIMTVRKDLIDGLKKKYGAKIALDVPRVEVPIAQDEPAKGPADAPIQIVEYSEFQCPFCSRVVPTVKKVVDTYGDKVRVVFRDFPLQMHQNAHKASQAAQCAHAQGQFWPYHDKLFENQRTLEVDNLKKYATEIGLDAEKFNACLDSNSQKGAVDADMEQGATFGVTGTPAFFINGRFLNGAQPFEAFQAVIDEELERRGAS